MEMLKQTNDSPIPFYKQVVLLYMGINWYFEKIPLEEIKNIEKTMYQKLDTTHISLAEEIKKQKDLTPEIENSIKKLISEILKECGFN